MRGKAAAGVFVWALALTAGAIGMSLQDSPPAQAATSASGDALACEELPDVDVDVGEVSASPADSRC